MQTDNFGSDDDQCPGEGTHFHLPVNHKEHYSGLGMNSPRGHVADSVAVHGVPEATSGSQAIVVTGDGARRVRVAAEAQFFILISNQDLKRGRPMSEGSSICPKYR